MIIVGSLKDKLCIGHYGSFEKDIGNIHHSNNLKSGGAVNVAALNLVNGRSGLLRLTGRFRNSGGKLVFLNRFHSWVWAANLDSLAS